MGFEYSSAQARVSTELKELTEQLWPEIQPVYEEYNMRPPGDKVSAIYNDNRNIKNNLQRMKFLMLYELSHGSYWHATDFWPDLRANLDQEDATFYATFMVEQAKRSHEKEAFSYIWIVRNYDNGNLKDVVSEDLLKEAANIGFWDFANQFFNRERWSLGLSEDSYNYYTTLMKYRHLIDLSRLNEFKQGPLRAMSGNERFWPDEEYKEMFEKARKRIPHEEAAWLARPFIEQAINCNLSFIDPEQDPGESLARELEPYEEYVDNDTIQGLLKEEFKEFIEQFSNSEEGPHWLTCSRILRPYLKLTNQEFIDFTSSIVSKDDILTGIDFVESNFPAEWLSSETLSLIQKNIIATLEKPLYASKREKEIFPNLAFIQRAIKTGFLDKQIGGEKIQSGLKRYLERKRRPGGKDVDFFLKTIDPYVIDPELYKEVLQKGIEDLTKRRRINEARYWSQKIEGGSQPKSKNLSRFLEIDTNEKQDIK